MGRLASKDTTFKFGDTPTTVAQVTEISGPNVTAELLDVSFIDDEYIVNMPVRIDSGEVTVSGLFDHTETSLSGLHALFASQQGNAAGCAIEIAKGVKKLTNASAVLTGYEIPIAGASEAYRFTATFKLNAAWVIVTGA